MNYIRIFLFTSILSFCWSNVHSQTFSVNTLADTPPYDDPNTTANEADDGVCADQSGHCSLRAAMLETMGGNLFPRTINVNIPGQINLKVEYGFLSLLDGYKLIGNGSTTVNGSATTGAFIISGSDVEVNGLIVKAENATALGISSGSNIKIKNSVFRDSYWGLSAGGYGTSNVEISDNTISGNSIAGLLISGFGFTNLKIIRNKIGTDPSGTTALPNLAAGISIPYSFMPTQITIGGDNISDRNIISGNSNYGIQVQSGNVIIKNNYVGTNYSGTAAIPNGNNGIVINSADNSIFNNVISGNSLYGIMLHNGATTTATNNKIYGNIIGGKANDTSALPNGMGIWITGNSQNNIIGNGNSQSYTPNAIVHNLAEGIVIDNSYPGSNPQKNSFRRNVFRKNGEEGIEIKTGTQANIQTPILDSLSKLPSGDIKLYGHSASPNAIVDLYYADDDPTNFGEGKMWLKQITADGDGKFEFAIDGPTCEEFTVMQTDQNGNSSEFSNNLNSKPKSTGLKLECNGVFISGVSYLNEITLTMDWKAMPVANRRVVFFLNGSNQQEGNIADDKAKVIYDMALLQAGNNQLTWKINDCEGNPISEPAYTLCAAALPFWLPTPTATCNNGSIVYEKQLDFPDAVAQTVLQVPSNVDFIAGALNFLGAPKFGATLKIPGQTPQISFNSSFSLLGFGVGLSARGNVKMLIDCNSITPQGNVYLNARASRTFYAGYNLGSYLPSCTGLLSWPLLDEGCQKLHQIANNLQVGCKVGGSISLHGVVTLNNGISLQGSSASVYFYAKPFIDIFFLHARGNGNIRFNIALPDFALTSFRGELSGKIYCDFPFAPFQFEKRLGPWTFAPNSIEKNYLDEIKYSDEFFREFLAEGDFYSAIESPLEIIDTTIFTGLPSDGDISMALGSNGKKAAAWYSRNNFGRPSGDISLKIFNGSSWLNEIQITNDINTDKSPSVAFDTNDNIILCWLKNNSGTNPSAVDYYNPEFLKQFDIAYKVISSSDGTVINSGVLTTTNEYDFNPKLKKGNDGSLHLIWQTSDGTTHFGKPGANISFKQTLWNGNSWDAVQTVGTNFEGIIDWDYAANNSTNAILAYSKDLDALHTSANDIEIFAKKFQNNSWQLPEQITANNQLDIAVHALYSNYGKPALSWLRDSVVVGVVDNFSATPTVWFDSSKRGLEYYDAKLISVNDTIVAAWQEAGSVYYSFTNLNQINWSEPFAIELSELAQTNINLDKDAAGNILLGFIQYPNLDTLPTIPINGEAKLYGFNINQPITEVEEETIIPNDINLFEPFPNPFNNQTKIKISLPNSGEVELIIYDLLGREIQKIYKGVLENGVHEFEFIASELSSGIYFLQLRSDNIFVNKKLVLIK